MKHFFLIHENIIPEERFLSVFKLIPLYIPKMLCSCPRGRDLSKKFIWPVWKNEKNPALANIKFFTVNKPLLRSNAEIERIKLLLKNKELKSGLKYVTKIHKKLQLKKDGDENGLDLINFFLNFFLIGHRFKGFFQDQIFFDEGFERINIANQAKVLPCAIKAKGKSFYTILLAPDATQKDIIDQLPAVKKMLSLDEKAKKIRRKRDFAMDESIIKSLSKNISDTELADIVFGEPEDNVSDYDLSSIDRKAIARIRKKKERLRRVGQ